MRVGRVVAAGATALAVGLGGWLDAAPARAAEVPGYVVSLGDSYISGEAGRWAGNTNQSPSWVDATGADTYFDNAARSAESIPGCHRSESAEVHIGGGVPSKNLACSGARVASHFDGSDFKPGLDFFDDGAGRIGQAKELQQFASANDVDMVVVSIGGNDFNFASIVQTCVTNFLLSPSWWPNYCNDDASVTANFTAANVAAKTTAIRDALDNARTAMTNAGYAPSSYTILVQTYPSPIPNGSAIRYRQSGYTRQSVGGCGFWNNDATWANATALPKINGAVTSAVAALGASNVKVLQLTSALNGRRLCENTVGLLEEKGLTSWTGAGAVDKTEWVAQIRTVSTLVGPYFVQESLHPSYWGQLAVRNCVRQAYNAGSPRGGACSRSAAGLTAKGEPKMALA